MSFTRIGNLTWGDTGAWTTDGRRRPPGRVLNDCSKRTAFQAMDVCPDLHGIQISWNTEDVADVIIRAGGRELK